MPKGTQKHPRVPKAAQQKYSKMLLIKYAGLEIPEFNILYKYLSQTDKIVNK